MSDVTFKIQEIWPEPPDTLKEKLFHFLDCYPEVPDGAVVLMATSNVYGRGVITGLTMGDVRALAHREALGAETVVYGPEAERLGRQLREKLAAEGRLEGEWGHGSATDQGGTPEGHNGP